MFGRKKLACYEWEPTNSMLYAQIPCNGGYFNVFTPGEVAETITISSILKIPKINFLSPLAIFIPV